MTVERLFKKHLKVAIANGCDHRFCDHLAGVNRKVVLTQAEVEAGKMTFDVMMADKLWNDQDFEGGWLFGSPKTNQSIGLIPTKLSQRRLGINMADWGEYTRVS